MSARDKHIPISETSPWICFAYEGFEEDFIFFFGDIFKDITEVECVEFNINPFKSKFFE